MPHKSTIREILEEAVESDSFSMGQLYPRVIEALEGSLDSSFYRGIMAHLGLSNGKAAFQALIRTAFLIELVKTPKIDSTKFRVRWTSHFEPDDPRQSSFGTCYDIFQGASMELVDALADSSKKELIALFCKNNLLPYELPIDYRDRFHSPAIHVPENIVWLWDDLPRRVVYLRTILRNLENASLADFFRKAYAKKIKVKTYLTDRVQTGDHKTNREKRWETHPASVHYALRRSCLDIEYALVAQICQFKGFSQDLQRKLQELKVLPDELKVFRCPITMEPLSFEAFRAEVLDPQHGKSSFHVGHLNPLKAINDDPKSGHTGANISWISEDGNRIQGHHSLANTRTMIARIYENYQRFDVI